MASLESIASALASTVAGTTATTSTAKTYRATVNGDGTVTIDGSTTTTPATYTVSASAGDRVTVTIEGHTATVTGNITDPSATTTSVAAAQETADAAAKVASAAEEAAEDAAEEAAAAKELAEDQSYLVQEDGDTGVKVTRIDSTGATVGDYAARVVDGGFLVTDADDDATVYAALTKSGTTFYDANGDLIAAYTSDGMVLYSGGAVSSTFDADEIVLGANLTNSVVIKTATGGAAYIGADVGSDYAGMLVYGGSTAEHAEVAALDSSSGAEASVSAQVGSDGTATAYFGVVTENGKATISAADEGEGAGLYLNIDSDSIDVFGTVVFNDAVDFEGTATVNDTLTLGDDIKLFGVIRDSGSGNVFTPQSDSGNTTVGYTRYANASGATSIYGDSVRLYSNEGVYMYTPNSSEKRLRYVDCGVKTVTPVAGEPTEFEIRFNVTFESAPYVMLTPVTSLPGTTVLGVGVLPDSRTTTNCYGVITRTTDTDTAVMWIAVGYLA